jgi:hypothetical protein
MWTARHRWKSPRSPRPPPLERLDAVLNRAAFFIIGGRHPADGRWPHCRRDRRLRRGRPHHCVLHRQRAIPRARSGEALPQDAPPAPKFDRHRDVGRRRADRRDRDRGDGRARPHRDVGRRRAERRDRGRDDGRARPRRRSQESIHRSRGNTPHSRHSRTLAHSQRSRQAVLRKRLQSPRHQAPRCEREFCQAPSNEPQCRP